MIFGILAMGGAIVVGLQNKGTYEVALADLKKAKASVTKVTTELGGLEDQKEADTEKETQAKDKSKLASAEVERVREDLKRIVKSSEDAAADLKKVEIEQNEIDLLIKKIFPSGDVTTAEDLRMNLSMLKDTLTEKQNAVAEMDAQYAKGKQAKQVQVSKVKKEESYQVERAKKLALNGMIATVIAVNREWGFVMVNAGRAHGVDGQSSLLVKRGNSRVARLRVVNLQDNVTVCDVVKNSLIRGITIQPGDKVIFENARQ